jgi:hypothetical protein
MRFTFKQKLAAVGATAAIVMGTSIGAYAYFSTSGSGSGSGTVGSSSALTLNQAGITYSSAPDNNLYPGTSATVTFTVDNPSSGHQELGTISVASITSNKAGCDSADHPTWFSATTDVVNQDYGHGSAQAVPGSLTVTFVNDSANSQDVCQGANLTFNYSA